MTSRNTALPKRAQVYKLKALLLALPMALGMVPAGDLLAMEFASAVVEYVPGPGVSPGFGDTQLILGGPTGAGLSSGSSDVLTLGEGGHVTVTFNHTFRNGPGFDLIVFENSLFFNGGIFGELAFVEVSSNGSDWARFPSASGMPAPIGAFGVYDPALVSGLAGNSAVFANVNTNLIDPFDPLTAGGDAFDLSSLDAESSVLSGLVDLQVIRFVRLLDIKGDGGTLDSMAHPIYDPWDPTQGFVSSADFDAVAVLHVDGTVAVESASWSGIKSLFR